MTDITNMIVAKLDSLCVSFRAQRLSRHFIENMYAATLRHHNLVGDIVTSEWEWNGDCFQIKFLAADAPAGHSYYGVMYEFSHLNHSSANADDAYDRAMKGIG